MQFLNPTSTSTIILVALALSSPSLSAVLTSRNLHTSLYCVDETPAQSFTVGPEVKELSNISLFRLYPNLHILPSSLIPIHLLSYLSIILHPLLRNTPIFIFLHPQFRTYLNNKRTNRTSTPRKTPAMPIKPATYAVDRHRIRVRIVVP